MDRAKALTGECAGEWVDANQPALTYEACKAWKLYCPKCYQPIHLRKSKKRKNYFAHYDFDDKTCPERSSASGSGSFTTMSEAHDQELEEAESFIRQIFYCINPDYFQALVLENKSDDSPLVINSLTWFVSHINSDISRWVRHYCKKTGFLDWQNSDRESSYIIDCLNILKERARIARDVLLYSEYLYIESQAKIKAIQNQFGLPMVNREEYKLLCLIALDLIVKRLASVAKDCAQTNAIVLPVKIIHVNFKVPDNKSKLVYKRIQNSHEFLSHVSTMTGQAGTSKTSCYILFNEAFVNRFWISIFSYSEKGIDEIFGSSDGFQKSEYKQSRPSISESKILRVTGSRSRATLYEQERLRRDEGKKKEEPEDPFYQGNSLELYIDSDNDLAVRGEIQQQYSKAVMKGVIKVLFNRSTFSMLSLLNSGCISDDIAEKAAQLAFGGKLAKITGPEALNKFKSLTKK